MPNSLMITIVLSSSAVMIACLIYSPDHFLPLLFGTGAAIALGLICKWLG